MCIPNWMCHPRPTKLLALLQMTSSTRLMPHYLVEIVRPGAMMQSHATRDPDFVRKVQGCGRSTDSITVKGHGHNVVQPLCFLTPPLVHGPHHIRPLHLLPPSDVTSIHVVHLSSCLRSSSVPSAVSSCMPTPQSACQIVTLCLDLPSSSSHPSMHLHPPIVRLRVSCFHTCRSPCPSPSAAAPLSIADSSALS